MTCSESLHVQIQKARPGIEPRSKVTRPTRCQWTNRAVHYRPRIKSQKTARSAAGVEPTTFQTAATDDDKDWRLYRNGHRGQWLHNSTAKVAIYRELESWHWTATFLKYADNACNFHLEHRCTRLTLSRDEVLLRCVRDINDRRRSYKQA